MNERERPHPESHQSPSAGPSGGGAPGNLNVMRLAGEAMLAAADDAIARVLSGDSEAFNQAVRQEGGQ